jgi:hypothetical protein
MMPSDPRELAEPLATAIVEALLTDDWQQAVRLISEVLAGGAERASQLDTDLRSAREAVLAVPVAQRGRARLTARNEWRDRISELLAADASTADLVLELTARLQSRSTGFAGYESRRPMSPPFMNRGYDVPAPGNGPPGTTFGDDGDDEGPPGTTFGDDRD